MFDVPSYFNAYRKLALKSQDNGMIASQTHYNYLNKILL